MSLSWLSRDANQQEELRVCVSANKPFTLSNDGTEFGGSIYHKVSNELETAVTLAWTAGSNNTRFGIAAKYKLEKDASLSVSSARRFRSGVCVDPL